MNFEVRAQDNRGEAACCAYCARGARRVVVLPLAHALAGGDSWLGVCAYCVLDMAKALQAAEPRPA